MEISSYLPTEDKLKGMKVRPPVTLFDSEQKPAEKIYFLKKGRCIHCLRKLRIDRKGNGRCVSKFKCKYFITAQTLSKYIK